MKQLEFYEWWTDFLEQEPGEKDGGYSTVDHLRNYVRGLDPHKRTTFLDELVSVCIEEKKSWGIAARVLETEASMNQRNQIYKHLNTMPETGTNTDLYRVEAMLRILAVSPTPEFTCLTNKWLLTCPIERFPHSIPWALWPHSPSISIHAWVRYFTSVSASIWRNTIIIQAFMLSPDALRALKSELINNSPNTWDEIRRALLEEKDTPWVTDEQRDLLQGLIFRE